MIATVSQIDSRLLDTRAAFDSVADEYDGPRGNNAAIQRMRERLWSEVLREAQPSARLLDIGCGTGIDAVHFASLGYDVTATDWSPAMSTRTEVRAAHAGVSISTCTLGAHEIGQFQRESFDIIYSNFGPLNCVDDLNEFAADASRLLSPGGKLIATVIGKVCPWEILHYAARRRYSRAKIRFSRGAAPVPLNGHTVWASYYTPAGFMRAFLSHFEPVRTASLCLFLPPPYLAEFREKHPKLTRILARLDDTLGGFPGFRSAGDHFLITMRRR